MRLTSAARTRLSATSSSVEDAATGELRHGAGRMDGRGSCVVTETAPATSSGVGRGRRRILRGDGGGTGDELRRGGRSHRLRRGRWTWSPVSRSRRRTRSPAMSSDVDHGRGRMRLPATRLYLPFLPGNTTADGKPWLVCSYNHAVDGFTAVAVSKKPSSNAASRTASLACIAGLSRKEDVNLADPAMATTRCAQRQEHPRRSCCGCAGVAATATRRLRGGGQRGRRTRGTTSPPFSLQANPFVSCCSGG
uniref:Uncharacterized protein n=1 Tax=Oryza nivara TaxID=4536 RepID=A0A0E0GHD8_ORYNI